MPTVFERGPKPGRVWWLEITASVGRRRLARILASIPGARVSVSPGWFSWLRDEPFCRFELNGQKYVVEASWPAGTTFELSPDPQGCKLETVQLRKALEERL